MSIEVTISQHVPAQFGERAYFAADCTGYPSVTTIFNPQPTHWMPHPGAAEE